MKKEITAKNNVVTEYWLKYYAKGVCTLCGNSGIIDTTGIKSPIGTLVGGQNFCICPNGQTMRHIYETEHK